ncbi:MAG: PQQ-binding-like beta-propeller repeat protein, partial [Bacteroidales bacterium]|nr:PQQ-binding-like beta-propeller repeat protein [Bacteroidales bacterium]
MIKRLLKYLAVVLAVAGCSKGSGSGNMDWNVFRGDSSLSGYTDQALPSKPQLLWSFTTGPRAEGSPVVKDGVTYWFDRRGKMYGVDSDGVQVFEKDFDTFIEATPLISGDVLYIGTTAGSLLAMRLPDGYLLWEYETEGQISASPNLVSFAGKEAVVVGSYDTWMYCIDASDGSLLSRYESG